MKMKKEKLDLEVKKANKFFLVGFFMKLVLFFMLIYGFLKKFFVEEQDMSD